MPNTERLDSPKRLVLSLLRAASAPSVPVRALVQLGVLFGASEGAMRVALTRLVAQGLVEAEAPGRYRLGAAARPLGHHVDEWRLGERRARPWHGDWLCVLLAPGADRSVRRSSQEALQRLGFARGLPGLWVRPDNLAVELSALRERLGTLGLEAEAELFRGRDFAAARSARWQRSLWKTKAISRRQQQALSSLVAVLEALPASLPDQALVSTFLVGGEAIRVLATDPLLPPAILPTETRAKLTDAMLDFDRLGRALWRQWLLAFEAESTEHAQGAATSHQESAS